MAKTTILQESEKQNHVLDLLTTTVQNVQEVQEVQEVLGRAKRRPSAVRLQEVQEV